MRTIKFRGKSEKTGEWCYGYYAELHLPDFDNDIPTRATGYTSVYAIFNDELGERTKGGFWTTIDRTTLCQFTGLKDASGKEIYEGDIVEAESLQPQSLGKKMRAVIVYDEDLACFDLKAKDRQRTIATSIFDVVLEVIGNIHDNPEMLNK